jgi:hypothetical protein
MVTAQFRRTPLGFMYPSALIPASMVILGSSDFSCPSRSSPWLYEGGAHGSDAAKCIQLGK